MWAAVSLFWSQRLGGSSSATRCEVGGSLASGTGMNLLGSGVPIIVAVWAIPQLLNHLGTERFGILNLVWTVIGYWGLFDLGLGRAATQVVSQKLSAGKEQEVPALVGTALILVLGLGCLGAAALAAAVPWMVDHLFNISELLQAQTKLAFFVLALAIPIVVSTPVLVGVLEARQRFGRINIVRVPVGALTFVGPLLVLPISHNLGALALVSVGIRVAEWLTYLALCYGAVPGLGTNIAIHRSYVRTLLGFGGWMTVTNVVGPFLVYTDRILIGVLLSASAVAYYVTPYEVATKLWILSGAVVSVVFPLLSATLAREPSRAGETFRRAIAYVMLMLFPPTLLLVTLASEGLDVWLGSEFAQRGAVVLQYIAIGVFINSLAQVPFALVQAAGRPDLTAKAHLVEMVIYLPATWLLIQWAGLEGAAVAWLARVSVDAIVLFVFAHRVVTDRLSLGRLPWIAGLSLMVLVLAALDTGMNKTVFLTATLLGFLIVGWGMLLEPHERTLVRRRLRLSLPSNG